MNTKLLSNKAVELLERARSSPLPKKLLNAINKEEYVPFLSKAQQEVARKATNKNTNLLQQGMEKFYSEDPLDYRWDGFVSYGPGSRFSQLTDLKSGSTLLLE